MPFLAGAFMLHSEQIVISTESTAGVAEKTHSNLRIIKRTKADGRAKALKVCGLLAAVTLVSGFIPIIHFVTIPAGLVAIPLCYVLVSKMFGNGNELRGDFVCPGCKKKNTQRVIEFKELPAGLNCNLCSTSLRASFAAE